MKKGNLLIVDDEPLILKRLKLNLEDYADEVFIAVNGVEALARINEFEIHCVICDINMPKMNGVDVIKNIRAKNNNVPFIFYTGHGNHDLMMEAAKYGAFDFLNKPNLDGLEEVVVRGLSEGFNNIAAEVLSEDTFISDYQLLLDQIDRSKS